MKAQSLSINLQASCNAHCPFCVSRLTWKPEKAKSTELSRDRLQAALRFARYHSVDTVLITSTGEPTKNTPDIAMIAAEVKNAGIPILELQTNGSRLLELVERPFMTEERCSSFMTSCMADVFSALGINTIAISISSLNPLDNAALMGLPESYDWKEAAGAVVRAGMLCRISLNLLKSEVATQPTPAQWLIGTVDTLKDIGVHQLTLRELDKPLIVRQGKAAIDISAWIDEHALDKHEAKMLRLYIENGGVKLRPLSYGGSVYDFQGLSVVLTDCMSDTQSEEVRSLILQSDGHLYHSWNYKGSILL
jgi:hypothetical protein